MQGAEELSTLRSRSPAHAHDLIEFTGQYINVAGLEETGADRRLRIVSCLLADIGWRSHPDYRGPQSVDNVAYGSLTGVDHPGRSFLAQVMAIRYDGLKSKSAHDLIGLGAPALTARARLIGAMFRVAYPMTAAMPGILPRIRFSIDGKTLLLHLPTDLAFLNGDHLRNRLRHFAEEAGYDASKVQVG
ncbi:hypothetical protein [Devosia aurantiaca]|uniref:hypothetical protein n=1 Tax=Devosia aurantiaca TaxID=2714858 RepID=UPI002E2A157F|nr:hypothetical protein [Devosia aurantiaca]